VSSGGSADARTGTHRGHPVVVRTMRVAKKDDLLRIRKVSVHDTLGYSKRGSDHPR